MNPKIQFAFEAVMVASGSFAVTPDEICNHGNNSPAVLLARNVFIRLCNDSGMNYADIAKAMLMVNAVDMRNEYDYGYDADVDKWLQKALAHYSFLCFQYKLAILDWR